MGLRNLISSLSYTDRGAFPSAADPPHMVKRKWTQMIRKGDNMMQYVWEDGKTGYVTVEPIERLRNASIREQWPVRR